jgi:hypothetical protein
MSVARLNCARCRRQYAYCCRLYSLANQLQYGINRTVLRSDPDPHSANWLRQLSLGKSNKEHATEQAMVLHIYQVLTTSVQPLLDSMYAAPAQHLCLTQYHPAGVTQGHPVARTRIRSKSSNTDCDMLACQYNCSKRSGYCRLMQRTCLQTRKLLDNI